MMSDREVVRMDGICARLGEHFRDYVVIARADDGDVSWGASNHTWAESAAREYFNYVQMGNHVAQMLDLNGGRDL